jgi:hypothetical protein
MPGFVDGNVIPWPVGPETLTPLAVYIDTRTNLPDDDWEAASFIVHPHLAGDPGNRLLEVHHFPYCMTRGKGIFSQRSTGGQ